METPFFNRESTIGMIVILALIEVQRYVSVPLYLIAVSVPVCLLVCVHGWWVAHDKERLERINKDIEIVRLKKRVLELESELKVK